MEQEPKFQVGEKVKVSVPLPFDELFQTGPNLDSSAIGGILLTNIPSTGIMYHWVEATIIEPRIPPKNWFEGVAQRIFGLQARIEVAEEEQIISEGFIDKIPGPEASS